jgi:hypothetical protein
MVGQVPAHHRHLVAGPVAGVAGHQDGLRPAGQDEIHGHIEPAAQDRVRLRAVRGDLSAVHDGHRSLRLLARLVDVPGRGGPQPDAGREQQQRRGQHEQREPAQ